MQLKRVIRLDSQPLNRAFFTEEGYLIDTPIVTTVGIFEYTNSDGSVRRELRLPEEVFAEDSLASYMAKPIIITHDAGLVNKDNVSENEIGTILSNGYRDGDNVRAKIVIHDTDEMKESGLKELSLGYNLDLDETPGEWNGQHYDAIQRNIRINHLALVREARAGETARLNIDSRDAKTKGVKAMSNFKARARRSDGVLSPDELKKAIEEYKARHPLAEKQDADEPEIPEKAMPFPPAKAEGEEEPKDMKVPAKAEDADEPVVAPAGKAPEAAVAEIKEKQENSDEDEEAKNLTAAKETIQHQDEDIQTLIDIIDSLLAERDFKAAKSDGEECEEDCKVDGDDDEIPSAEEENTDDADDPIPETEDSDLKPGEVMNADSIDAIVRERVKIGIAAEKLNLDGVENMSLKAAKKAIISAVRPTMNLDGKSAGYINVAFDYALADIKKRTEKGTDYQRKQMFNGDSKGFKAEHRSSAEEARQKMIERRLNKNAKEDM